MRTLKTALLVVLLVPSLVLAQSPAAASPPPLVPAPPQDAPLATPPPPQDLGPPTPPPPGATPLPPGMQAPSSGYPYSPYGTPYAQSQSQEPPKEIGLMVSEGAFGILTAAGTSLLPYFLFKGTGLFGGGSQGPQIQTLLTILVFGAVPLTVSQTQLSLANGSRYYISESWPSALSGLATEAAVLGIYAVAQGFNPAIQNAQGADSGAGGREALLLIGSVIVVPLVEMAVINLTKEPRFKRPMNQFGAALSYTPEGGLQASLPTPAPFFSRSEAGAATGMQFLLLAGRF